MKLQTKFNLGIVVIFLVLALSIGASSVWFVNANTIKEAKNRVSIYTRAAWEIRNGRITRNHGDEQQLGVLREELERVRQEITDVRNLLAPDGTVIRGARYPYNAGDGLATDPIVQRVIAEERPSSGNVIFA